MKLLLVEDDRKIAAAITRALDAEGFTVDVAATGDDGWWMATEAAYDLIILDVMLPGRDGLAVCAELRKQADWTPILMLTARDSDADVANGLNTGADDYLIKPFAMPVLIARIRSLLRRAGGRDTAPTAVGALRCDSATRQAWSSGHEVSLTRREFDVFEFLLRRAGRPVSKDEILSGVWEFDFEGDPNIVEVYIRRLRRKLDEPFGTEHIRTVRGRGYRIERDDG